MQDFRSDIRTIFNAVAQSYDQQRRHIIPCFDDFYGTAVSLAEAQKPQPDILDIGAGTGLLSAMLLKRHPGAKLALIDISDHMMAIARKRFENRHDVEYIIDDFASYDFTRSFDLVVSALAIHHLTDKEKSALYRKVYGHLKKGGVFINADQVLGSTAYLETLYKEDWINKVKASPLSREDLMKAGERTRLDKMATLEAQLGWLKEAGFADVDCIYKFYNFVVLYARKT